MINKIKIWAKKLKLNISALYLAYKHKATPWYAKILAVITVSYALSPIDLIPDFIPVLGFLDDAILLPVLIWLSLRVIPKKVIEECKEEAKDVFKNGKPKNYFVAGVIILLWTYIIIKILFMIMK